MRLSMALNDLKIVSDYAVRQRQPEGERLYFIRLFTLHMREIANLVDPPDTKIIPTVEQFLDSLPRGTRPSRTDIRRYHGQVMRRLTKPMKGRPKREFKRRGKPSVWRVPTLRDELKRIRDDFAHYGHNAEGADNVIAAMSAARELRTGYTVREKIWRAQYADAVAMTITHPFDLEDSKGFALDMHGRIVDLVGPVARYIHHIEAAWLNSRPPKVVRARGF